MKREDIKVTFENNVLTDRGRAQVRATDGTREQYHRVERGYGAFRRSFTLPATVDAARVSAGLPGRRADRDAAAPRRDAAAADSGQRLAAAHTHRVVPSGPPVSCLA